MTEPNHNAFAIFGDGGGFKEGRQGLTKREYFAAMAMQGLCADNVDEFKYPPIDTAAKCAVSMADALIKALNA